MAVHCLYRDFFRFLDDLHQGNGRDRARWESFRRLYFGRHSAVLSSLWFDHQTYTLDNIRERVSAVKPGDYGELRDALLRYDLPAATRSVLERCAALAGPFAADVYLLVGFFSPDAFAADFEGTPSVFVGLERFRAFGHYPVLLAHECGHLLARPSEGHSGAGVPNGVPNGVPDRAVREGLAVYFSRLAFPGEPEHSYLFMRESAYRDLLAAYPDAGAAAAELRRRGDRGAGTVRGTCGRGGRGTGSCTAGEPRRPREVYFLGYTLVREYAERTGSRGIRELAARSGDISVDFGLR